MADADLVKTAITFYENVLPQMESLAEYGLSQADLDELLDLKNNFLAIYTKPKGNLQVTAQLTAMLPTLFASSDKVLEKMDALVKSASKSDPNFVDEYFRKRNIVQTPTRTRALQLTVLNDSTSEPFEKAKVTLTAKSGADPTIIVKRTGGQGRITNDTLAEGEYNYEVEYVGFLTEKGSFSVNDGVTTNVVIRLKKSE